MGKVYANQTLLELRLDTEIDLTDITTATIKYDGIGGTGTWAGVIEAPATAGIVTYNGYDGTLPAGRYKLWVYLTHTSGKVIPSDISILVLHEEGT